MGGIGGAIQDLRIDGMADNEKTKDDSQEFVTKPTLVGGISRVVFARGERGNEAG
jgi:hypothetical protein